MRVPAVNKILPKRTFSLLVVVWLLILGGAAWRAPAVPEALAQGNVRHYLIGPDPASPGLADFSNFPTVRFRMRAVDGVLNQTLINIKTVTVFEDGLPVTTPVSVTAKSETPILFIYMIDRGNQTNFRSAIQSSIITSLNQLIDSGQYFRDNIDRVTVYHRIDNNVPATEVLKPPTTSTADFKSWIDVGGFATAGLRPTNPMDGLNDILLNEVPKLVPRTGSQSVVLFPVMRAVGTNLAADTIQQNAGDIAARARGGNVLIYPLQISPSSFRPITALFEPLRGANGGTLAVNLASPNLATEMQVLLQEIVNRERVFYEVEYRSASASLNPRTITVNAPTPLLPGGTDALTYTVAVQPPVITQTAPAPGQTINRALLDSGAYDTPRRNFQFRVEFPDGFERGIASSQLNIPNQPIIDGELLSDGRTVQFDVDLTAFDTPGTFALTGTVTVRDELGMAAPITIDVPISVEAPPEVVVEAWPTCQLNNTVCSGVETWVWIAGALLSCGVLFVILAMLGLLGRIAFRPSVVVPASGSAGRAGGVSAEQQHTLIAGPLNLDRVYATLTVLEGPKGLLGEALKVTKATSVLGRNPKATDITFYADEESSVSRVHATLQQDAGQFKLTDNGSSSGTRLNGRNIRPNDPVPLQNGDEIVLGDLARRGVKLRFNAVEGGRQVPKHSGPADDRTMILDAPDVDDQFDRYKD